MKQGNTGTTRTGVFPTRAQFDTAVAAIPTTKAKWQGEEGPRFRLEFSPGSVRVTSTDLGRANRSENERMAAHLRQDADMLLSELNVPGKRGVVKDWSQKSRSRMSLRLATLDYAPLFETGGSAAMVTLTLPRYWEVLTPNARSFKRLVNIFRERFASKWGVTSAGVWKMEFQRRGAPHLHIVMVPPAGVASAPLSLDDYDHLVGCDECGNPAHDVKLNRRTNEPEALYEFPEWLSRVWSSIVFGSLRDAPVPYSVMGWIDQRAMHERAGTGVDYQEVENYSDPKRIGAYFAKHGSYFDKEYQNHAPALWKMAEIGGANFWGYWVVRPLIVSKETHEALIMHIVRHLRKLADAASYSRKTRTVKGHTLPLGAITAATGEGVPSDAVGVDPVTGELLEDRRYFQPRQRKRSVARRVKRFRNRNGYGFLVLNDGLAVVSDIARIISAAVSDEEYRQKALGYDLSADGDGDWFGSAPDHAPRGILALDNDFHRQGSAEADELIRAQADHARRRRLGLNRLGEPLPPVEAGAERDLDIFGHGGSLAQFLSDLQTGDMIFDETTYAARKRADDARGREFEPQIR